MKDFCDGLNRGEANAGAAIETDQSPLPCFSADVARLPEPEDHGIAAGAVGVPHPSAQVLRCHVERETAGIDGRAALQFSHPERLARVRHAGAADEIETIRVLLSETAFGSGAGESPGRVHRYAENI